MAAPVAARSAVSWSRAPSPVERCTQLDGHGIAPSRAVRDGAPMTAAERSVMDVRDDTHQGREGSLSCGWPAVARILRACHRTTGGGDTSAPMTHDLRRLRPPRTDRTQPRAPTTTARPAREPASAPPTPDSIHACPGPRSQPTRRGRHLRCAQHCAPSRAPARTTSTVRAPGNCRSSATPKGAPSPAAPRQVSPAGESAPAYRPSRGSAVPSR